MEIPEKGGEFMAVKWPNRDYRQIMNDGEILVMIDLLYIFF